MKEKLNHFQRKLIRIFISNVKQPDVVANEKIYEFAKLERWTRVCKKRRTKWLGEIEKAEETPAQKAMRYALEIYKSRQGRPPSIWISPIKNVFKEINVSYDEATETATIKNYWKK